ncbi:thermonuclease family protein [Candidatus Dojkabacteria bacterium]|nr:thermonuclease family protein [Candidatus Dojkabacteria bacterium]
MENANKKILFSLFVLGLIALFSGVGAVLILKDSLQGIGNVAGLLTSRKVEENILSTNIDKYLVDRVIDGDTIDVVIGENVQRIRMIGIDTPELKGKDCFALDAKLKLTNLIDGKEVEIKSDPTQENKDRYGRLLRYVYLDGVDINREMIKSGFAKEYTYEKAYVNQLEYRTAQIEANVNDLGIWKECE